MFAQSGMDHFLKPVDTLNIQRRNAVVISEVAAVTAGFVGLNELWYKDYPRSSFHFINDNEEWLQMDKLGHVYSAYHLGRFGSNLLQWSGVSPKNRRIYGATLGFGVLTMVETLDGFSQKWGASSGDILANATGTALFISQDLLWKEQRIVPKFSFHKTAFSNIRPSALGSSYTEKLLKDYNGQTYWLSFNIHSFIPMKSMPKWLNIAVGYGANGMLTGRENDVTDPSIPQLKRYRQWYLSLDADLTKIQTKSHFLKTLFSVVNTLKVPAPTLEVSVNQRFKMYFVYF